MKKINSESGQTLIVVALGMTMLLGFAGLATDVGVMLHEKRQLQAAADSAALGAAASLNAGGTMASAVTAGQFDASQFGFTDGVNGATITIDQPTNDVNPTFNANGYVEAIVTQSTPTFLIRLFGKNSMVVSARAVATDQIQSNGCLRVNDPSGTSPAADLGGDSLVLATKCGVDVEGDLTMSGSSQITAASLAATGSINFVGNGSSVPAGSTGGAAPTSDPLGYLSQDLPTNVTSSGCTPPTGSGFTAAQCFVNAPLTAGMKSGFYVFTQQPTISGNTVSGASTTSTDANGNPITVPAPMVIYLQGSIPFQFSSNLSLDLAPPSSGIFKGVLIDAPNDVASSNACVHGKGNNNLVNGEIYFDFGSSTVSLTGTVYAPNAHLFLQDEGAAVTIDSDLDIGTLCQQSADITIAGQTNGNAPTTRIGLVE